MRRIIVPLDGSALAEQAIPTGAYLAKTLGTSLELVHVIERSVHQETPEWIVTPSPDAIRKDLEEVAGRYKTNVPVSCDAVTGDPVQRLLRISERDPQAIIVMATHGRGGVARALLGSVADKVVRGASGPVVLVRPECEMPNVSSGLDTILVTLDGSDFAERALPQAIELARGSGARLHLVRVIESLWSLAYPTSPYDGAAPDPYVVQDLEQELTADATTYLMAVASRLLAQGVEVTWQVSTGRPVDEIILAAEQASADLIVTTSHGRGGVSRMFQGSVATGLLSRSPVPLMVIPPAGNEPRSTLRYEPELTVML